MTKFRGTGAHWSNQRKYSTIPKKKKSNQKQITREIEDLEDET